MRFSRQDKIIELITTDEIETQEALVARLAESGYQATQATISRDIRELRLVKILTPEGKNIYSLPPDGDRRQPSDRYDRIFRNTVNSVESAENIIVMKTISGCANAAGEAFDSMQIKGVVGSLAGDNTIFAVIDRKEHVPAILKQLRSILHG